MSRYTGLSHRKTGLPSLQHVFSLSLALNVAFALAFLFVGSFQVFSTESSSIRGATIQWHGGHPLGAQTGTCSCSGKDGYCMCTPSLAIDLVIASGKEHLWLVRRKDTDQLATMGGFVMVGESVEDAVKRELKEETGIVLKDPPVLFGVYSDPRRDNRRHTVSAVYAIHLDGNEHPVAADDVKDVKRIPLSGIEKYNYFADHKTILLDYRRSLQRGGETLPSSEEDFAPDILRSVCKPLKNKIMKYS